MTAAVPVALLLVKVYTMSDVPAPELRTAWSEGRAILDDAGIAVRWLDCSSRAARKDAAFARCRRPLAANEVVLRIVATSPPVTAGDLEMGSSIVDERSPAPPILATVYRDRVWHVARGAAADRGRLLGRAMAHEIGHLLLNHTRHAQRGLMRASWSQAELRRNEAADWMILEEDAAAMRAAVTARG